MEQQLEHPVRTGRSLGVAEWIRRVTGLPSARRERATEPVTSTTGAGARTNGTAGLSRRELEVIRLLPQGMTNQQIARELVVSEPTVATHVRHILQKTGAANRAEAAAFAVRHQLD